MREEVFLARIIFSVILIIFFAAATVITAYAFFASESASTQNKVSAAKFGITVEIDGTLLDSGVLNAEAGTEYTVKVTPTGNAETGFCVMNVTDGPTFHTSQLESSTTVTPFDTRQSITFKLICESDCTITFSPHWGISIYYAEFSYNGPGSDFYIENKDPPSAVTVPAISPSQPPSDEPETNESETNEPETNESETQAPETDAPQTNTPIIIHTVKSGETLSSIAKKYGTTTEILMDINSIADPNMIFEGQKLEIPS